MRRAVVDYYTATLKLRFPFRSLLLRPFLQVTKMLLSASEKEIALKRAAMIKAYHHKSSLLVSRSNAKLQLLEKETRILPQSPIIRPREKKFNHAQGCSLAAQGQKPPRILEKWWEQTPSAPGEKCNSTQRKLANRDFFTGTNKYRDRMHRTVEDTLHYRTERLLSHESSTSVYSGHRSGGDVHNDVMLRLLLRESVNI